MDPIKKIKKEFKKAQEYASNSACVKAGKQLLEQAKTDQAKLKESGKKSTYNAALEMAHYVVGKAKGRIRIMGGYTYCCFDCLHKNTNIQVQGKPICCQCSNGAYFVKKGNN